MGGKNNQRKRRAERASTSSSATKKRRREMKAPSKAKEACVFFQDEMRPYLSNNNNGVNDPKSTTYQDPQEEVEGDVSVALFELANAPLVGYRVDSESKKKHNSKNTIIVQQDVGACGKHTGGIVWETAWLLTQYLLAKKQKLGKTLEVGAGCGLLGQVLAAQQAADLVVMTETKPVMANLLANVERNNQHHHGTTISTSTPIRVHELDWEHVERDAAAAATPDLTPHSFDTILGTDVVFTPKLVEPLWKTLQYMSHPKTNIYLCLQERCAASHQLLLEKASVYHFEMRDITHELDLIETCRWGSSLECRLFHIVHIGE